MILPNVWSISFHWKRVPLLHNTVLFLCDEGDGLVAVFGLLDLRIHAAKSPIAWGFVRSSMCWTLNITKDGCLKTT